MFENITQFLNETGFVPHGHCFLWTPGLVWLYSISDTLIALAYYSIPIGLAYIVERRRDLQFSWVFVMFAIFIFACGTTHLLSVWNIWHTAYWTEGVVKAITAIASVATAVLVWPLIPKVLALPSSRQIEATNRDLEKEVEVRRQAEQEVKKLNEELEKRVQDRTIELEATNSELEQQIIERKRAEAELQRVNHDLKELVYELEQNARELSLLKEMGELLQTCVSSDEANAVIARYGQQLFTVESGAIFMHSSESNSLEAGTTWGDIPADEQVFAPEECWGLRRGKAHLAVQGQKELYCRHIHSKDVSCALCIPLVAQGETMGVLHLRSQSPIARAGNTSHLSDTRLIEAVAEHASLALANLKLRETLRIQAMHDALTGLYNRRFMEETLQREIRRAERSGTSIGIIMLDIDYFKKFNDTFGHEGGDALLRDLGHLLRHQIRGSDIACRYGGEEFTIILQDSPLEVSYERAEQLRVSIAQIGSDYEQRFGRRITVSLGVASFPQNGSTWQDVLRVADQALYKAKALGRDRVVAAEAVTA